MMPENSHPSSSTGEPHPQRVSEQSRTDWESDHRVWCTKRGERYYWFLMLAGPLQTEAQIGLLKAQVPVPGSMGTASLLLNLAGLIVYVAITLSSLWPWRNPLHWCATAYFVSGAGWFYLAIQKTPDPPGALERGFAAAAVLGGVCMPLVAAVRAHRRARGTAQA